MVSISFLQTGYSFGYGFVDYNSEVDSEEAIQKLNGFYVRNKRLKVRTTATKKTVSF